MIKQCLLPRYQLSLYTYISNIVWSSPKPDLLSGVVSNLDEGQMQHFSFRTDGCTQFELVNRLWNLMGTGAVQPHQF